MTRLIALASVFAVAASPLAAQVPPHLTTEDSAMLRTAVLRIMLDSLGPDQRPARIWIQPYPERDSVTEQRHAVSPTAAEWAALSDAFPTARVPEPSDTLFQCPPGVQVRMPGTGCPIRDHGVIVRFRPLRLHADSVRTGGVLIQSAERSGGRHGTWAQGVELVFLRVRGAWRFVGVRSRWVT